MNKSLIILLFFFLFSCFRSQDTNSVEIVEVRTIAKEVQIPKVLMANVANELLNESKTVAPVYMFMPLQVQFSEFNTGVLKNQRCVLIYPKVVVILTLKRWLQVLEAFI